MSRDSAVSEMAIAEPGALSRWQILLLGFAIALVFYLALALMAPVRETALYRGAVNPVEPSALRIFSWGGTDPGQTHYSVTIRGDHSLELAWSAVEAVAAGGANTGVWINSRTGSLCLSCD
jgi:hypothetical protein